jgi:hypothetical protein
MIEVNETPAGFSMGVSGSMNGERKELVLSFSQQVPAYHPQVPASATQTFLCRD